MNKRMLAVLMAALTDGGSIILIIFDNERRKHAMNEKYIVETVPATSPLAAQITMNKMDQQGYRVLAVSHGHVSGSICFIITFERKE